MLLNLVLMLGAQVQAQPKSETTVALVALAPVPGMDAVEAGARQALGEEADVRLQGRPDTLLGLDTALSAGWKCTGAPKCMAILGRALAVDVVVSLSATQKGGRRTVRAQVVDVVSQKQVGVAVAPWPNAEVTAPAAARLVRQAMGRGQSLTLACAACAAGSTGAIDGLHVAFNTPMGGLAPGAHAVVVQRSDGANLQRTVELGDSPLTVTVSTHALTLPGEDALGTIGRPPKHPRSNASTTEASEDAEPGDGAGRVRGLGVLAAGGGLTGAGLAFGLGALVATLAGAGTLASLDRQQDGRAVARESDTAASVFGRTYGGLAMLGVGAGGALASLGLVAAGLVAASVGAGLFGTGG